MGLHRSRSRGEHGSVAKVAIGPSLTKYGGGPQYFGNIVRYSKHPHEVFQPNFFSFYENVKCKRLIQCLLRVFRIERADVHGTFLSKKLSSKYDIVHLQSQPYWPEVYHKPRKRLAKYVHTVHQVYLEEDCLNKREWQTKNWLNKLMFKSCRECEAVISVARWQQKILLEEGIESIHIPMGVCVEECETADPTRFEKRYGVNGPFFLFAAKLHKVKRPEIFVQLAKKMSDKNFVMIGKNATINKLRSYVKSPLPRNIVCLGGLRHSEALDAIAACKVLVLPSKNETFGVVLLEAMACKKPVVATNNAGPKEIVANGKSGFLFEPDNVDDLYRKACKACEHPKVGLEGHRTVKKKFDWPVVVERIDRVYDQLLTDFG